MEQDSKSEPAQVSWNLSAMLIQDIGMHLAKSSMLFAENKFYDSYKELVVVEMRISTYFSDEEKKQIRKYAPYLDKGGIIYSSLPNGSESIEYFRKMQDQIKYHTLLKQYNDLIMDALKKYGFLIKPSEDSKKMF